MSRILPRIVSADLQGTASVDVHLTARKGLRLVANQRLDSWKSIAAYLSRGIRTVQRWHSDFGMPVHHFGGTKGCVFAYTDDLDRWLLRSGGPGEDTEGVEHSALQINKARSRQSTASADAMWGLRSERNLTSIVSLYRDAVDADPGNSAALIGLSRSLIGGALLGVVDGFVAYPSAAEALRRVPRDGSDSADALCAAAWLNIAYEHRWREARAALEEVLQKDPGNSFALAGRALLYIAEGKLPEAFEYAWKAWSENPLAAPLSFLPCWIRYLNQDYGEALELLSNSKASGAYGANHAAVEALVLTQSGALASHLDRIIALLSIFPHSQVLEGVLGYGYAVTGHPGKAWEMLVALMQSSKGKKQSSSYLFALIMLGLGEKQEAMLWLERSYAEGSLWCLGFRSDPILEPLRGERHFEALLRRIGAPVKSQNDLLPRASGTASEARPKLAVPLHNSSAEFPEEPQEAIVGA